MSETVSGTKEWAQHNVNCWLGCEHRCRYCYARANALRFKQIESTGEWGLGYNRRNATNPPFGKKYPGRVMFPSTHDITPRTLGRCYGTLCRLLEAGNDVLIVSKPHREVIEWLCAALSHYRDQITWRFTLGAMEPETLAYWEPGAPPPAERLYCLAHAFYGGYRTSVSCEPLLTGDYMRLFDAVEPYVTDTIWFGRLNRLRNNVIPGTDEERIRQVEHWQADGVIRCIFADLQDEPKVRWKESYKKVLGLDLASAPGLDV